MAYTLWRGFLWKHHQAYCRTLRGAQRLVKSSARQSIYAPFVISFRERNKTPSKDSTHRIARRKEEKKPKQQSEKSKTTQMVSCTLFSLRSINTHSFPNPPLIANLSRKTPGFSFAFQIEKDEARGISSKNVLEIAHLSPNFLCHLLVEPLQSLDSAY